MLTMKSKSGVCFGLILAFIPILLFGCVSSPATQPIKYSPPTVTEFPASTTTNTSALTLTSGVFEQPTSTLQPTYTVTLSPTVTIFVSPTQTAAATPTPEIGSTQVSPRDGMLQVYVPAGEFLRGSLKAEDSQAYDNELPQLSVYLDAFWIDQTDVTNDLFTAFIRASGYQTEAEKKGLGYVAENGSWNQVDGADWQHPQGPQSNLQSLGKHPVVQVSWSDAQAYCQWAGRRLPSEAEWEKAARGTNGNIYPWGNTAPGKDLLNFNMNVGDTTAVGSYPSGKSPYGALDMAGNVWDWVNDWYGDTYYRQSPSKNPTGPTSGTQRVLRGGSWYGNGWGVRSAAREEYIPDLRFNLIGFRCAAGTSP